MGMTVSSTDQGKGYSSKLSQVGRIAYEPQREIAQTTHHLCALYRVISICGLQGRMTINPEITNWLSDFHRKDRINRSRILHCGLKACASVNYKRMIMKTKLIFAGCLTLCMLLLPLVALHGQDPSDSQQEAQPRRFHDIKSDINAFLKREATAETDAERIATIRDICALYLEIKRDPRLALQPTLQGYKNTVWTRLHRLKIEFNRLVDDETRHPAQIAKAESDSDSQSLAQQLSREFEQQMQVVSRGTGGPVGIISQASGAWGGGAIRDNAAQLIELIQKTIEPESWDVNGGNGAIFFYQPLNALVVRATSEVHFEIGGAMGALRAAGR
jgi:hypothetical protein